MSENDSLEQLTRWLTENRQEINVAGQVTIRQSATAHGERTVVSIDHRLAGPSPRHPGWRISTKRTDLPGGHFSSLAMHYLKSADHQRGRTIYCHDNARGEVIAAMTYHIDERPTWPVFITMIGLRTDFKVDVDLRNRTLGAAYLLKQYVHAISGAIGRGGDVHIEIPGHDTDLYATELGFRRAAKIKGLRVSGTGTHMRQEPI
jgi:hypothetical protein